MLYWPKADPPGSRILNKEMLVFFPSRNKGFPLGRKNMSQYVFFLKYEMKQNKPFSWNKNNYIHNNSTVSRAPLLAKIISPQIVLSYREDPKSIRL